MSPANVPLDPREITEIDELVSVLDDLALRERFRSRLLREAQAAANEAALDRKRFREAVEFAEREGYADPEAFAHARTASLRLQDIHEQRVQAVLNRASARSRRRSDKTARTHEVASKSANPTRRRLPQRDRDYVDLIGEAEKGGWLAEVPLVLSKIQKKLGYYRLPHWEKTTISLKVMAMSIICGEEGAQTINLRLNPTTCARALTSSRGAVSYMQDRIRKALDEAFGRGNAPDFWFTVETDWRGVFHLHGAVITPTGPGARDLVDQALRNAGGRWDSARGAQHQQVSTSLDEPIYWASYAVKHMNVSSRAVAGKLFASSSGVRAKAAGQWDDIRGRLPQSPRFRS